MRATLFSLMLLVSYVAHAELGKIIYSDEFTIGRSVFPYVEMTGIKVLLPKADEGDKDVFVNAALYLDANIDHVIGYGYYIGYMPEDIYTYPPPCLGPEFVYPNPNDPADENGICYVVSKATLIRKN